MTRHLDGQPASPLEPGTAQDTAGNVSVGVVLAAGRSQRLRAVTGHSKALLQLGGISLVERAVRTLRKAGVDRVIVVVGNEADLVSARLAEANVEIVLAQEWEAGNGASLAAANHLIGGEDRFVLMCGDHIFADGALDEVLRSPEAAVLVDSSPDPAAWGEGTRVRIEDGQAVVFAKTVEAPAIDCGVFVLSPAIFAAQQTAAREGDYSLAGAVTHLAVDIPVKAVELRSDSWWQDVDTPQDLKAARALVRRSLGKNTDGPVSRYLNRPISTRITMLAAPFRVPPNAFSLLTLLVGMWAAWSVAAGQALLGGALIHAASVLDGSDGETARLRGTATRRGALVDAFVDRATDGAILAGLWLWAFDVASIGIRLGVLAVIGLAFGVIATRLMAPLARFEIPRKEEPRFNAMAGGRDARMLILAIGAIAGLPLLAFLAAVVTYAAKAGWRVFHVIGHRAHQVGHSVDGVTAPSAVPLARKRLAASPRATRFQLVRFLLVPLVVVVAFGFVLPRYVDLHDVWALIGSLSWEAKLLLLLLTAWNIATYWPLRVLSMPGLSLKQAAVVDQSSTAVALTVPAGGALAVGVSYAMYASWGFGPAAIASSTLATFVVGTLVKLILPAVALVALLMQGEQVTGLVSATLIGAVALAGAVAVLAALLWREGAARRIGIMVQRAANLFRRWAGRTPHNAWGEYAVSFRSSLSGLLRQRGLALSAAALISQLSIFAVMVAVMRFAGITANEVGWAEALAVFASVRLASSVPILPGNVGLAEFGYIGGLVLAGGNITEAVAVVLLFRFLTFFVQIPIGGITFLMWRRNTPLKTMEPSAA